MSESACEHIVGFDLGDGETAATIAPLIGNDPPMPVDVGGQSSQITAIGYLASGAVVIGDEARQNSQVTRLLVRFKRSPNHSQFNRVALTDFFQFYVRFFEQEYKLRPEETRFIVGAPSGWTTEERERYGQTLRSAGPADLCVVPESRAAFLNAREAGHFREGEMRSTVLVIDIGSSTTDFTIVQNLQEQAAADFGHVRLGAGLIEAAILEEVLKVQAASNEIRAVLERNPHLRSICEARCRDAKEAYFSAQSLGKDASQLKPLIEVVDSTNILRISVDDRLMEKVLNQPFEELEGESWLGCYRNELKTVKDKWGKTQIAAVLMTGGGAKMKFTRQICEQIFSESRLIVDPSPELCIAKGLARVGRVDHRAKRFLAQIQSEGRDNVAKLVSEHIDGLFGPLAEQLAAMMVERVVKPRTYQWRDGEISTLVDYEQQIEADLRKLGNSVEVQRIAQKLVVAWLNENRNVLLGGIHPILADFGIPSAVLDIEKVDVSDDVLTVSSPLPGGMSDALGSAIAAVAAAVVGYVVAAICGGAGVAILMSGPIGFIPGIIVGLAAWWYGKDVAADWIKSQHIPVMVRTTCVHNSMIDSYCVDALPQIESAIKKQMLKDSGSLQATIMGALMELIERKAKETTVWIDC